jgi:hypothetical protein
MDGETEGLRVGMRGRKRVAGMGMMRMKGMKTKLMSGNRRGPRGVMMFVRISVVLVRPKRGPEVDPPYL